MTSAYKTGRTTIAMLLAGALVALAGCSPELEQVAVEGSAKAAKLTECVAPTDVIRRNHMEMIKHQRDETVRKGIRKTDDSLAGCVDCHVQYDQSNNPVPVNAEGQFCAGCHEYTGTSLACFQCHAAVPKGTDSGPGEKAADLGISRAHALAMIAGGSGDLRGVEQEEGN